MCILEIAIDMLIPLGMAFASMTITEQSSANRRRCARSMLAE